MLSKFPVYLTQRDITRLADFADVLADASLTETIRTALRSAIPVAPGQVPQDVAGMGSIVRVHDRRTRLVQDFRLVFPGGGGDHADRLVVLTPAGLALLGARVGDLVSWPTTCGRTRTVQVESVCHPVG